MVDPGISAHLHALASRQKRLNERLHAYWLKLKGNRAFPRENEIDPDAIADIWPACFLISIDSVTRRRDYRYSYLGDELAEAYGEDIYNPDTVLRLLSTEGMPMVRKFDEVVKTQGPAADESEFINQRGQIVKYRICLVPLGSSEEGITHILGCMRWRAYKSVYEQ